MREKKYVCSYLLQKIIEKEDDDGERKRLNYLSGYTLSSS